MPFPSKESGQGIVEYLLIIILIVIVIFVIISLLGPAISKWINDLLESLRSGYTFPAM